MMSCCPQRAVRARGREVNLLNISCVLDMMSAALVCNTCVLITHGTLTPLVILGKHVPSYVMSRWRRVDWMIPKTVSGLVLQCAPECPEDVSGPRFPAPPSVGVELDLGMSNTLPGTRVLLVCGPPSVVPRYCRVQPPTLKLNSVSESMNGEHWAFQSLCFFISSSSTSPTSL